VREDETGNTAKEHPFICIDGMLSNSRGFTLQQRTFAFRPNRSSVCKSLLSTVSLRHQNSHWTLQVKIYRRFYWTFMTPPPTLFAYLFHAYLVRVIWAWPSVMLCAVNGCA